MFMLCITLEGMETWRKKSYWVISRPYLSDCIKFKGAFCKQLSKWNITQGRCEWVSIFVWEAQRQSRASAEGVSCLCWTYLFRQVDSEPYPQDVENPQLSGLRGCMLQPVLPSGLSILQSDSSHDGPHMPYHVKGVLRNLPFACLFHHPA